MHCDCPDDPEHDTSNEPDDHEVDPFRSVGWFDPPGRYPTRADFALPSVPGVFDERIFNGRRVAEK